MSSRSDIKSRIVEVLRSILGADFDVSSPRMDLTSLKMIEVVVGLETEFSITIPDDAPLAQITKSLSNMVAYVNKVSR